MTTIQVKVRIPTKRVAVVRDLLAEAGTDIGGIVNMLFARIERTKGVPFEIFRVGCDPETEEILNDADAMKTIRAHRAGKLKMKPFRL